LRVEINVDDRDGILAGMVIRQEEVRDVDAPKPTSVAPFHGRSVNPLRY